MAVRGAAQWRPRGDDRRRHRAGRIGAVPVASPAGKNPAWRDCAFETGCEFGGIWQNRSVRFEGTHLSMRVDAPELHRRLNVWLGREAGQEDPDVMALIWIE